MMDTAHAALHAAAPFFSDDAVTVYAGDCRDVLPGLPDCSVDAIVTDPPYFLEFMDKEWDGWESPLAFQQWCQSWAAECLRILKPGGHMLAFGGPRTFHRLTCGVEDAGFDVRDCISWLHSNGFPKSVHVGKAVDKTLGAERPVVGTVASRMPMAQASGWGNRGVDTFRDDRKGTKPMAITEPATDEGRRWEGWGTALKPAWEPIIVARKPLAGTVASNVLTYGTGALNIDGCRVQGIKRVGASPALAAQDTRRELASIFRAGGLQLR